MPDTLELQLDRHAPIATWFGVGGAADRLATPRTTEQLQQCVELDPGLRVLGDGANLLVADGGVRELVVDLKHLNAVDIRPDGLVRAQAGADLMRLVQDTARAGLSGLHTLAGVPASIGGAVAMNAGGAHGSTFDHLVELTTIDRRGNIRTQPASAFAATYRSGGLDGRIVIEAVFQLAPADAGEVRDAVKAIMRQKKESQPLAADSAGCVFKNPTPPHDIDGIGRSGQRVSAGMLIDRAGCKGQSVGGAAVSERHANFMVVNKDRARARDVLELIEIVRDAVRERFAVELETEVVIWGQP